MKSYKYHIKHSTTRLLDVMPAKLQTIVKMEEVRRAEILKKLMVSINLLTDESVTLSGDDQRWAKAMAKNYGSFLRTEQGLKTKQAEILKKLRQKRLYRELKDMLYVSLVKIGRRYDLYAQTKCSEWKEGAWELCTDASVVESILNGLKHMWCSHKNFEEAMSDIGIIV